MAYRGARHCHITYGNGDEPHRLFTLCSVVVLSLVHVANKLYIRKGLGFFTPVFMPVLSQLWWRTMNMEFNKIFAAVLVAGITASFSGFVAYSAIHPKKLVENAYPIDGVAEAGSTVVAVPAGPEPILALMATADVARGEQAARACAACHTFNKGGAQGIGPNLYDVVNGGKAHVPGFAYSNGLKAAEGSWSYESLNHFLWKPKSYISDTKMNFVGLRKAEDRAAVIAWLRTLSASPAALPSATQIAAEAAKTEQAAAN